MDAQSQEDIKQSYLAGKTLAQLADKYDCSLNTIRYSLRKVGVQCRNPGRPRDTSTTLNERAEQFIELRSQNKTLEEIGSMYGITRERVRQVLKKYGVYGLRDFPQKWPIAGFKKRMWEYLRGAGWYFCEGCKIWKCKETEYSPKSIYYCRECGTIRAREYTTINRDRVNELNLKWQRANRDKVLLYGKKWRGKLSQEKKDEINKRARDRYHAAMAQKNGARSKDPAPSNGETTC